MKPFVILASFVGLFTLPCLSQYSITSTPSSVSCGESITFEAGINYCDGGGSAPGGCGCYYQELCELTATDAGEIRWIIRDISNTIVYNSGWLNNGPNASGISSFFSASETINSSVIGSGNFTLTFYWRNYFIDIYNTEIDDCGSASGFNCLAYEEFENVPNNNFEYTYNFTIGSLNPPTSAFSSPTSICGGSSSTLTASGCSGSVEWYSNSSGTGASLGTGSSLVVSPSISTNYYAFCTNGSCISSTGASTSVTVTAPPSAGTLSGNQSICDGSTTTFSSTQAGGSWSSSNTGVATVNASSGVVTGQSAGTATITYTVTGTGGCSNATATRTVTVTAPPSAGTLSGNQSICDGSTTTFSSTQAGGSWSSSNTGIATVNASSGVVTGQSAGTATITYTVTGTGGCSNATATRTVTVTAPPSAGTLSGNQSICDGSTTTFSSTQAGGSWSSSNTGVATVNASSGVVTGQSAGTATITYTVTGTGGCSNATATRTVTVTAPPNAGTLSGNQTICDGSTTTFSSTQAGGSWSSSNTGIATVNASSGVVTGQSAGTATITYTVTGTGGCSNATATRTVTVNSNPTVTVPNGGNVCEGETLNLTPTTGGTWTSSDAGVATIDNSGVVTGVSSGTADMTFTETSTGCSSSASSGTITVNPLPTFTVSTTDPTSCGVDDGTITISGLNALTPYDVSLSSGAPTSVNSNGAGEIVMTGLGAGSYSPIEVTLNGCSTIDNGTYDLNDPSSPTITVPNGGELCVGDILNLTPTTGGTWTSSDNAIATIDNAGVLEGIAAGTVTVIYTETSSGCSSLASDGVITVNPTPTVTVPNGGEVCEGAELTLTPTTGGTWTSSDNSIATVTNGGVVTGVSAGTAEMTFTNTTTGCSSASADGTITVNASPTITVPVDNEICIGSTLSLSPSTGGTWSSNDATIATITNSGEVTGVFQGTTEMVFTDDASGCSSIVSDGTVIVNAPPTLTTGAIDCDEATSTFSVEYTASTGATVTSNLGDVNASSVSNVPNDQEVVITASIGGCPSTTTTVSTDDCDDIIIDISNGVSPNSDGLNDFFVITSLDAYPDNNLTIYNRWGDKVFQLAPYNNEWNGQNNVGGLGGEELPAGTYFYILELGDDEEPIKGYVELKR